MFQTWDGSRALFFERAMLRLIRPRLTTKLNQRELVKAWPMLGHEASPTSPEIPVSLFQEFAISCVLDHLYTRPYSTDQRRFLRSKILDRDNESNDFFFDFPARIQSRGERLSRIYRYQGSKGGMFRKRRRGGSGEATLKRIFMSREESAHRLTRSQEENRIKHI